MLKEVQRAHERGHTKTSWLESYHSFSFGNGHQAKRVKFGKLLTLNEDFVQPSQGFASHPHVNIEIVSIVLRGQLEHRDSLGHQHILDAGGVQAISAGSGIIHSEMNPSSEEVTHFLQIWFAPRQKNLVPHYAETSFDNQAWINRWVCIASPDGWHDSLLIQQDSYVYLVKFEQGYATTYHIKNSQHGVYCYLLEGVIDVAGERLYPGDGIGLFNVTMLNFSIDKKAHFLCIEVPM